MNNETKKEENAWERWRRYRSIAKGYDFRWLKWGILLAIISSPFTNDIPNKTKVIVESTITILTFGGMIVYFGHLLFKRLPCSMLVMFCLLLLTALLQGLIFTAKGLDGLGLWKTSLCALGVCWIFYGAVIGLTQARILKIDNIWTQTGLMLFQIAAIAAPVVLFWGIAFKYAGYAHPGGSTNNQMISDPMLTHSTVFIIVSVVLLIVRGYLGFKCIKVAKKIIDQAGMN